VVNNILGYWHNFKWSENTLFIIINLFFVCFCFKIEWGIDSIFGTAIFLKRLWLFFLFINFSVCLISQKLSIFFKGSQTDGTRTWLFAVDRNILECSVCLSPMHSFHILTNVLTRIKRRAILLIFLKCLFDCTVSWEIWIISHFILFKCVLVEFNYVFILSRLPRCDGIWC
jgi:hypothetical protein